MKKYLILLLMAATVLASCSKDEDPNVIDEKQPTTTLTAKDIIGTWSFVNPTAAEVVVEGSDKELVSSTKKEYTDKITSGISLLSDVITFKNDMICTVTRKLSNGSIENFKGTYTVTNNRVVVSYTGVENTSNLCVFNCSLEKKSNLIFLVIDKQTTIEKYNQILLLSPYLTNTQIASAKNSLAKFTAGITKLRCPLKMVKTAEQTPTIYVTANQIAGTWAFQNPTATEVVVKGTNTTLVNIIKKEIVDLLNTGEPIQTIITTFKSDMTCLGVDKYDGFVDNYKGTYTVINGRLKATLSCEGEKHIIGGALEKKGTSIYLNIDKQATIDGYNNMLLTDLTLTSQEKTELKALIANMITGISEISCPLKMVKQ